MREQKRPYRIAFVPEVVCWTDAPESWRGLRNQRARWEQGALETIVEHRRMLFNPRYGRIGLIGMPLIVIEDVLGPPCELFGYLLIPILYFLGIGSGTVVLACSEPRLVLEPWRLRKCSSDGRQVHATFS